jgi:glycosyltransferase involved in cell wall biosynthesis
MDTSTPSNRQYSTTRLLGDVVPDIEACEGEAFTSVLVLPQNDQRVAEGGVRTQGYFKQSRQDKPLVSIVTIVYNGEQHLEQTILSVLNQDYENVEYIIIDGGSTDKTLDIIRKYEGFIDYWVSEKDKGISDAFNKGVRCSLGDLVGLINADDYYEDHAINAVVMAYLSQDSQSETVYYGNTHKITTDGKKEIKKSSQLSWCLSVPFSHCSSFLTRSYYKHYGLFSSDYKIAMDVELLMRGLKQARYIKIDQFIAIQRDGGVSDSFRLDGYKEYHTVSKHHFGFLHSYLAYLAKLMIFYKNKVVK